MSKTQPARGMRDFLPADIRKRNYVINIIREVYESYGFEPLETPAVENLETLTGKYGEEGNQLMFRILKRGEKLDVSQGEKGLADLALRYDLTVPLARVVANYRNELPKFFKRYQIQPVWRADRPAKGRFREFYQCVDAIGSSSMMVEAELISAVSEIFRRLGFDDFVIRINHRDLLDGMMGLAMIAKEKRVSTLVAIDKLDKIGVDGVKQELSKLEIGERSIETIINYLLHETFWSLEKIGFHEFSKDNLEANREKLNLFTTDVKVFSSSDESKIVYLKGLKILREIIDFSENSISSRYLQVDQSLARGLSYYTGAIMEITVPNFAGSLAGGGRYDGLIGMFGKEQIPACGLSIGLERILYIMEERGMFEKLIAEGKLKADSADVLVTVWDEKTVGESLKLANELRSNGLRVLVYPEADKLGKQFKYADSIGIKTAIIMREEEIAENKVKVKNLQTSEEETFAREEIAEKIKSRLL
jgi:histidyl-tRNA synthetase